MTDATLDPAGDKPAVRLERTLPDPPEVVWRAITDREELKRWFPCDVIVDGGTWTAGAKIAFPFPSDVIDMTLTGQVLEVDEPRRLSYTWGEGEILTFEIFSQNGGSLLRLTDRLDRGHAARNAVGWDECLDRLAGLPARPGTWQERFAAYSAAFEPRIGPQEGPPAGLKS